MAKQPKTTDLEYLILSVNSFNGSGYADMDSPESFLASYVDYKRMKNKPDALLLVKRYRSEILEVIDTLLLNTYGAGRKPSQANMDRFQNFRQKPDQTSLI